MYTTTIKSWLRLFNLNEIRGARFVSFVLCGDSVWVGLDSFNHIRKKGKQGYLYYFPLLFLFFLLSLFHLNIDTSCPTHHQSRRRTVALHRLLVRPHQQQQQQQHHHHQDTILIRAIYHYLQPPFYIIYPLRLLLKNWIFICLLALHSMDSP